MRVLPSLFRAAVPKMRSFGLALVACLLALVVGGLWFVLDSSSSSVRAFGKSGGHSQAGVAPGDLAAAAEADEGTSAEHKSARTALASTTAADTAEQEKPVVKKSVHGKVLGPDGSPRAGAHVWAATGEFWIAIPLDVEPEGLPSRWLKVLETDTDEEGRYAFDALKPGPLRVAVRSIGCAPSYRERMDVPASGDFNVPDVKLERGVTVTGRVLDPAGKPAFGVRVLIALDCVQLGARIVMPGRGVPMGTTDADGRFRVDQLNSGPWHLYFEAIGCMLGEADGRTERAGEEQANVLVRLEVGLEIAGRVRADQGALPPDLRVQARLLPRENQHNNDGQGGPQNDAEEDQSISKDVRPQVSPVDAEGKFVLRGLKTLGRYRLTLSRKRDETWKPVPSTDGITTGAGERGVEIVYKAETALAFRAVDDRTGEPITEMTVSAGSGRYRALRDDKDELLRKFVDGRVRYGDLRVVVGKPTWLKISAPGFKDHEDKNVVLQPALERDLGEIRLVPEHKLVVTVLDENGAPVADARVLASTKPEDEVDEWSHRPPQEDMWAQSDASYARTDAKGVALLTSMPGKAVILEASAKEHSPSAPLHARLPSDEDATFELHLRKGGTILVHVGDGRGGSVPGVQLAHRLPAHAGDNQDRKETGRKTDDKGVVRFEALETGTHAFRIEEEQGEVFFWNRDDSQQNAEEKPWTEAVVKDGGEVKLELTAPPRGSIQGLVRESGRPLEGAVVKLVPFREGAEAGTAFWSGGEDPFSATTDHTGRYKIESRRCGEYTAFVTHALRRMAAEFRVRVDPIPRDVDFDLDLTAIEGRVVDPQGEPLAGLVMSINRAQNGLEMEPPYRMVVGEDDRGNPSVNWKPMMPAVERTDSSGRYSLRGVTTGIALVVQVDSQEVEHGQSPEITVQPGEIRHGVDFVLRRAGKIQVTFAGGQNEHNGWYIASVIDRSKDKERTVQQSWIGSWNREETMGSIVPGHYFVRITHNDSNENGPPLKEYEVDVVVGETTHVVFEPH